jgi:hypothetical protein
MATPRSSHTATLLPGNQVLVVGGSMPLGTCCGAYAERYTPLSLVGGRGLSVRSVPGAGGDVVLQWNAGTGQSGYLLARIDYGSGQVSLLPPEGLPASSASTLDPAPLAFGCYVLIPLRPDGAWGTSDDLCVLHNIQSGPAPTFFTLALNQSTTASLTWTAPAGLAGPYVLLAIPLNRAVARTVTIPMNATSATDDTGGVPTCYVLFATTSTGTGISEGDCGIPGISTLTTTTGPAAVGMTATSTGTRDVANTGRMSATTSVDAVLTHLRATHQRLRTAGLAPAQITTAVRRAVRHDR